MQKPYLEAGKIVNTHGVRGEVRIQPWADDAAFLLGFRTFYIDGAPVHVAHSRVHKGMLVVKFADYDDVNAAMTLKNRVVSIARADVTLSDGQYFQQDLIGIAVETDAGEPLGTLREILDLPRGSVYVVQGAREVLIPDRPEFVCSMRPSCPLPSTQTCFMRHLAGPGSPAPRRFALYATQPDADAVLCRVLPEFVLPAGPHLPPPLCRSPACRPEYRAAFER